MRVAIVAMMKNEERYIEDWVKYHSGIGITDFILFDNNDIGNAKQHDIVLSTLKDYNIILIELNGRKALEKVGFQIGAYNLAYNYIRTNEKLKSIDYVIFIDIDEYLYFYNKSITDFLSMDNIKDAELIHLNWQCYGDSDNVFYDTRPVWQRFTRPCPIDVIYDQHVLPEGIVVNNHVKSILKVSDRPVHITVHTCFFNDEIKCVNSNGDLNNFRSPYQNICYNNGLVKHYITKTAEEYVERRILNYTRCDINEATDFENAKRAFFSVNTATKQKLKLFDDAARLL